MTLLRDMSLGRGGSRETKERVRCPGAPESPEEPWGAGCLPVWKLLDLTAQGRRAAAEGDWAGGGTFTLTLRPVSAEGGAWGLGPP